MSLLQQYKHISFDLDGTLVHTVAEYRHKVVPLVVEELGGAVKDPFYVDRFWFESGRDAIIREGFQVEPNAFWKLFRIKDTIQGRSDHTKAYPDAEPTVQRLNEENKLVSIVTGAPHWIAQMEIKKLNGVKYHYHLSIHDGGFKEKPDPKSLLFTLDKLNVLPKDTLYIGNSNEDAFFAKNAGVDFVYLERKEHPFDLKKYTLATIHSLDELFTL